MVYIYIYEKGEAMKKLSTLIVKVTREEHAIIKKAAIDRSMTMSKMILQAIMYYIKTFNR